MATKRAKKPAAPGLAKPSRTAARRPRKAAPKPPQDIGSGAGRVARRLAALEHQARAAEVALALANARVTGVREIQALAVLGMVDLSALRRFLIERPAPRRAPVDKQLASFVASSKLAPGGAR